MEAQLNSVSGRRGSDIHYKSHVPAKAHSTVFRWLQGAPEIQAFCLGHTAFVTCSAFVGDEAQPRLLTGSGDGTVR